MRPSLIPPAEILWAPKGLFRIHPETRIVPVGSLGDGVTAEQIQAIAKACESPTHAAYESETDDGERSVFVDEVACAAIVRDYARLVTNGILPWLDFGHYGGHPTAHVTAVGWDPKRGIVARIIWTSHGLDFIRAGGYSLSPNHIADSKTGRPIRLSPDGNMGAITDKPAFGKILALPPMRRRAATPSPEKTGAIRHAGLVPASGEKPGAGFTQ